MAAGGIVGAVSDSEWYDVHKTITITISIVVFLVVRGTYVVLHTTYI